MMWKAYSNGDSGVGTPAHHHGINMQVVANSGVLLYMFGPTGFSGPSGHFAPLFLGHGLEPTLPADLITFAAYGGHVCGEV